MKYSTSKIGLPAVALRSRAKVGVITSDDPPRGGLGRALREIVSVLQQNFPIAVTRKSRHCSWWVFRLQKWIDRCHIQVFLLPVGPGGLFLLRKPKHVRTIVICYHTYSQQCRLVPTSFWKRMFIPFERRTLQMADRVLCYCEDTQRVLEEEYGLKNVRVMKQILPILEVEGCKQNAESSLCLYVGRKDRRKGFHVLMEAWEYVRKSVPHAELRCITQGDTPDQELHALMRAADLVIVPSYLEGFGLVAAQSMMMGRAVLACNSDGLKSLIRHGETGWLVPPGDRKALADAWVILLGNIELREYLGARAAKFMREKFNRANAEHELVVECCHGSSGSP